MRALEWIIKYLYAANTHYYTGVFPKSDNTISGSDLLIRWAIFNYDVIFQCVRSSLFVNDICKLSEDKMKESHNNVKKVNIIYTAIQMQRFS